MDYNNTSMGLDSYDASLTRLHKVWKRTILVGAVCLGLVNVLMLVGIVVLSVHYTETKSALESRADFLETKLSALLDRKNGRNVAFAASLGNVGDVGPFNENRILIYSDIFVNTGAYNSTTGIFTAPFKGVYFFMFSGHNNSQRRLTLTLMKNGIATVMAYQHAEGQRWETVTNSISLILEVGDRVYVELAKTTWVYDNSNRHTTLVAHLLFPM